MPPRPSVGQSQAPLTSPCPYHHPKTNHNLLQRAGLAMLAMLIRLNKIHQISVMAAFATSLLFILDPNTNSALSLGLVRATARVRARVTELVEPVLVL